MNQQVNERTEDTLINLNSKQASKLMGLSARTLDIWRYAGKGPRYYKLGGRVVYRQNDLMDWMESRLINPEAAE